MPRQARGSAGAAAEEGSARGRGGEGKAARGEGSVGRAAGGARGRSWQQGGRAAGQRAAGQRAAGSGLAAGELGRTGAAVGSRKEEEGAGQEGCTEKGTPAPVIWRQSERRGGRQLPAGEAAPKPPADHEPGRGGRAGGRQRTTKRDLEGRRSRRRTPNRDVEGRGSRRRTTKRDLEWRRSRRRTTKRDLEERRRPHGEKECARARHLAEGDEGTRRQNRRAARQRQGRQPTAERDVEGRTGGRTGRSGARAPGGQRQRSEAGGQWPHAEPGANLRGRARQRPNPETAARAHSARSETQPRWKPNQRHRGGSGGLGPPGNTPK